MAQPRVAGSFRSLFLYDLCDEILLGELRGLLGAPSSTGREPQFRHLTPEYVRFERPPVVETLPPVQLASGEGAGSMHSELLRLRGGQRRV